MVGVLRNLLQRAEQGEIAGLMHVISVANAADESGITGTYADDQDYALRATKACLYAIQANPQTNQLPLRLRKGYQNEDVQILPLSVRCL